MGTCAVIVQMMLIQNDLVYQHSASSDSSAQTVSKWLASMSMAKFSAATASSATVRLGADANMTSSLRCWNLSFFSRICNAARCRAV